MKGRFQKIRKREYSLDEFLPPRNLWPDLTIPEEFGDLPERFNLADLLLDRHVREGRGSKIAIYFEDRGITYEEMTWQVNRLASSLIDLGIFPRDRVGLRMINIPQALIANFAILKIGAIPVPISPLWSRKEIEHVGADAQLSAIFVNRSLFLPVKEACNNLPSLKAIIVVDDMPETGNISEPGCHDFDDLLKEGDQEIESVWLTGDDIAILLYTSGTTGMPKGCAHTLRGVWVESRLVTRHVWDLEEGDVLAGSAPISFAAGYGTFAIIPFATKGAISLLPKFSPEALMKNIEKHRVTVLTGIPTAYRKLLETDFKDYDTGSLRLCTCGGDSLGEETFDAWLQKTGLPIWENFGATEFFNIVFSSRMAKQPKRNSIGFPLAGFRARIVDEMGNACQPGVTGTLQLKGPTGTIYWNPLGNQGRLLELQEQSVADGWNVLRDVMHQDEEGYYHFVSREDEMIKSSGYRLSPKEIEDVLNRHPLVVESAVVGIPDPLLGNNVKAFVVLDPSIEFNQEKLEEELKLYCQHNMAIYKIPRLFEFVERLPKTPTGKLAREILKEKIQPGRAGKNSRGGNQNG